MPQLICLFFAGIFFLSTSVVAEPASLAASKNQVRVAIMGQGDFHPDRTVPGNIQSLPDSLAARIIEHLSASKRFEVVERSALRRVIREQQFGLADKASDLDKVIEKTVDALPKINGWTIAAAGTVADHNDRLKAFKNLGTTVGADYLVYAVLEKHQSHLQTQIVPYSDSKKTQQQTQVDARLRLRVIETEPGRIVGADSIHTQISETAFNTQSSSMDAYSMYDHLGIEAANRILDMIFPASVVSKDPWVINRGSDQFIQVGDRYTLVREGKEIKDSSNISIGRIQTESGMVEVTQVQPTLSVVRLLNGDIATHDLAVPVTKSTATIAPATNPLNAASDPVNSRPRLAIGLVKSVSTASKVNQHIPHFTDTLISRLSQTKRFQLIDRQEVDQLLNEQVAQAMANNTSMPSAMGQLKGADYLVIGSVASFVIAEKTTKLPGSSRIIVTTEGQVEGNMRIVDARSGDIVESKKVSVTKAVKKSAPAETLLAALADAYADQVTVSLMNTIYPIKVAAVVSGVAYINRGSDGGLTSGEILNLMRPGQAIIDPDTGIKLGVAKTRLGELTLIEVDAAKSSALTGALPVQVGDILERHTSRKNARTQMTHAASLSRTGGNTEMDTSTPLTLVIGKIKINPRSQKIILDQGHTSRMTNDLMIKMSQFPEFDIMERDEIDQILDEKTFTAISNQTSLDSALQELLGADYLVNTAVDVFKVRSEQKKIPYTDELQTRYFGTVEATARVIDVHTGKLASAVKIRMNDRLKSVEDSSLAYDDLIDRFSSELAAGISADILARRSGDQPPPIRKKIPLKKEPPKVNRPNF